jgi:hypothetical protein
MENYKVNGTITEVSEVKTHDNGAKSLTYRIDNGNEYNNVMQFELYKKAEYAEHIDNFVKFNKVGDQVEVEFSIRTREWEGKIYTNLSSWKVNKGEAKTVTEEDINPLPF